MVTATTGNIKFTGLRTGKEYSYSIYVSDVAAAFATFSTAGPAGTGSSNFIAMPEDVIMTDISTLLSPTVAVTLVVYVNNRPTGDVIQDANTLSTLNTRSFPRLKLRQGALLQFIQA